MYQQNNENDILFPVHLPKAEDSNIDKDRSTIIEPICCRKTYSNEKNAVSVASVRIFADPTNIEENEILGVSFDRGRHSFITIENISIKPILIGNIQLDPFKTISLGTFSRMKTNEHSGLWIGMEARNIFTKGTYKPRVSLRCDITEYNLRMLNQVLPKYYQKWTVRRNCVLFTQEVWNSISNQKVFAGRLIPVPKKIYESIKATKMYVEECPVPYQFDVYYVNAAGRCVRSKNWN